MDKEHLDEMLLAEYLEGCLAEREGARAERELARYAQCLEAFLIARDLRHTTPVEAPPSLVESALRRLREPERNRPRAGEAPGRGWLSGFVERLRALARSAAAGWQPAAVRAELPGAGEERVRLHKAFGALRVDLEFEKTGNGQALVRITAASGPDPALRASLRRRGRGREICSYPLDGPHLVIEAVAYGHYVLELWRNGGRLGSCAFEIKESRHGQ